MDVTSKNMTVGDYVASGLSPGNPMTAILGGLWDVDEIDKPLRDRVDQDVNRAAIITIKDNFSLVGITERFDESLILLKHLLGWQTINMVYAKKNVTRPCSFDKPLSHETLSLIEKHNLFDIELYKHVCNLFDQQVRGLGSEIVREEKSLRKLNRLNRFLLGIISRGWVDILSQKRN